MKLSAYVKVLNKKVRNGLEREKIGRASTKNILSIVILCIIVLLYFTSIQQCEKAEQPITQEVATGITQQVMVQQMAMKNQEINTSVNSNNSNSTQTSTTTKETAPVTTTTNVSTTSTEKTTTTVETIQESDIEQNNTTDVIVQEFEKQEEQVNSYTVNPTVETVSVSINETVDLWSDYELLAHLIFAEAGGCTQDEMLWTGQVVLNRVDSQYFPNSIREVIFQTGQYSTTWDGRIYLEPSQECYDAAQLLMDGNRYIPSNVLFQTNGYLNYTAYASTEHGLKFYTYGE